MSAQIITLDSVINDYLEESEQPIHKYAKIFHLGYRCMDELGLDFFYQVKSVRLLVTDAKTADLPQDYLNYSKVGVFNGRGEIVPMRYNNNLSAYAGSSADRASRLQNLQAWTADGGGLSSNIFFNFWGGTGLLNVQGLGWYDYRGSFKIDETLGLILLDETFYGTSICLEYVASPKDSETYYVPVQFREAIISYLRWKDILSMPSTRKGSISDKQQRRHEWFNDRRLAVARYKPFHLDQYGGFVAGNTGMTGGGGGASVPASTTPATVVTVPSIYETLSQREEIITESTSATIAHSANKLIQLDASTHTIVYTINPALLVWRTLTIRCMNDTNGVTVQTSGGEIIQLKNGLDQTSVQLMARETIILKSDGSKLIEL